MWHGRPARELPLHAPCKEQILAKLSRLAILHSMKTEDHAQDARATIKKRRGAYLPHWTRDAGWYSVTFRLSDSLPQHVIESWLFERKNIIKTAEQMKRPLSEHEERRLAHLYSERVERYLDNGYGSCFMKDDRIARQVRDALLHLTAQGTRWQRGV